MPEMRLAGAFFTGRRFSRISGRRGRTVGGSAYAAAVITGAQELWLTGVDIKSGSITGSDVKALSGKDVPDGSLLAQDFGARQLPPGEQSPHGNPGP